MTASTDYVSVTELAGEEISQEQLQRLNHRYVWAAGYSQGLDVVEVACGSGPGLGLLNKQARSLVAGDISSAVLKPAQAHYGDRVDLKIMDAESLPFADRSKDLVLLFEAIYYLPNPKKFIEECSRILRRDGRILIVTANKDLLDFNPSPFSHQYFGARELTKLFAECGMATELFGYFDVAEVGTVQKLLRPAKAFAVRSGLMPRTMAGKRFLKRLVFGKPTIMPAELEDGDFEFVEPVKISGKSPDTRHKVIYCVARK